MSAWKPKVGDIITVADFSQRYKVTAIGEQRLLAVSVDGDALPAGDEYVFRLHHLVRPAPPFGVGDWISHSAYRRGLPVQVTWFEADHVGHKWKFRVAGYDYLLDLIPSNCHSQPYERSFGWHKVDPPQPAVRKEYRIVTEERVLKEGDIFVGFGRFLDSHLLKCVNDAGTKRPVVVEVHPL